MAASLAWGAPRQQKPFTYFESFESADENTAADPRDRNGNSIIDCGTDNDCRTITPCDRGGRTCDEWTLPLTPDPNLKLANEATPATRPNIVYMKMNETIFPDSRGSAGVVAPGSQLLCPADQDNGVPVEGVRADRMDFHLHTVKTPDIDGIDSSKPGTQPKAFRGQNSLHWGRHVRVVDNVPPIKDPDRFGDTYGLSTISAFILDRPGGLNLASSSTSEQPLRMTFWHIMEACDYECFTAFQPDTTDDMGIVEVSVDADPGPGATWGPWQRVEATLNPYESLQDTNFTTPTYEPPDDINPLGTTDTETTMCWPLLVWASQGSAKGTDATNCGDADGNGYGDCGESGGPVARGSAGVGVWALSAVDLSPYAGRHIRMRFIATTLDGRDAFISYLEPTAPSYTPPEASYDDGWYIDDIRVSGLVATEGGT